ncbi:Methyltransferase domain-containing protein [Candidatus Megaera venefica]|uniref:Methyltransferase domain-containing protein n=1 Tax=Candidatus Megaera venefica TaxID=2055910 RepID=A0ABU5NBL5_9RICK|nr:class I SAM-dependent methyltransferase [Candidatus Megaera venefica]MEA0970527.1 Methyltransferase domain-containing protein [Candidatus Megaera venefica]
MTNTTEIYAYDEMPYESYPYIQSSPEKLATLGKLFGMNPPKIETARVLELGSAAGGNLIPHAVHYPKGYYVGVDLSKVQVEDGQKHIKAMGLKNIELKHCSITDVDESFGKFDYIICHGVFSWVPEFVQDKIFEICNKNLSENGIAYISYNTLPGWNMIRTVRDMMMYHAKSFVSPLDKIAQARALLAFVKESLEGQDTPYAKMLSQEAELLSKQRDHYIRHEYLEDNNKQFYFTDFMADAAKQGLQYLSDVALSTMYLGNMKPSVVEKLQSLNDIVKTEQYLDFINNRRFRSTLLCHGNVAINRALNNDNIREFAISLDIVPEKPFNQKNLESNEVIKFFFKGDENRYVSSSSPCLKAALYVFVEYKGYPLKLGTIAEKASKFFKDDCKAQIEADLLSSAMNLVMKGYMEISLFERDKSKVNLEKPTLSNLALYQVNNTSSTWITGFNHAPVGIDIFDRFALKYMDGKNTKKQILDNLVKEVADGQLTVNKDNIKIEDPKEVRKELVVYLDNTITRLSTFGVFE